jgi:uncharacterized protein YqiB (DUF1249 family)
MAKSSYSVDLIKQMAECDANYIRLLKLVPHLQAYRDKSFVEMAMLNNTGREKDIIGQLKNSDEPEKLLEGLFVEFCIADETSFGSRVTVEIEIVEAFKYTTTLEIRQKPVFGKWMYHSDEKMQVNMFLGEWLTHSLKVGRSTELVSAT